MHKQAENQNNHQLKRIRGMMFLYLTKLLMKTDFSALTYYRFRLYD